MPEMPLNSSFTFESVPCLLVEDGGAEKLGELLKQRYDVRRVMVVTDAIIVKLGLLEAALTSLQKNGFSTLVFDEVEADPLEAIVLSAAEQAKNQNIELVIGFGGGSSMDVAKLVAILAKGQQALSDMYGVGNVRSERLPLIMVPTTSGTGSEVTPISVVTTGAHTKMGVSDRALIADMALMDATLTVGLPRHVTAATGIDAMVHAIESYTSRIKKNPISDTLAVRALTMLGGNIIAACDKGDDLDARRAMLVGAMLAGQAFANAPVGAVHALAYPLGGRFHIPHGHSNSLVLPHVLRFNAQVAGPLYAELADAVGLKGADTASKTQSFIDWLVDLTAATGIETRLRDMSIGQGDLPMMANDAMLQQRLLVNNPRDVSEAQALEIYSEAW
jgi:alcohol dehydrogenase